MKLNFDAIRVRTLSNKYFILIIAVKQLVIV